MQQGKTLWQRRIEKFKANKRGFISLKIFLVLFVLTMGVELYSNDKPILVKYDDSYYFPIFKKYAETEFGGDFQTEADYLDPYVQKLIAAKGFMIMPFLHYRYDTINYYLDSAPPTAPNRKNLLGTDDGARDVLARLIYGLRISLLFHLVLFRVLMAQIILPILLIQSLF